MEARDSHPITMLLEAAREGDGQAFDRLYAQLYEELRRLARVVRHGRAGQTLSTTALVHEAYVKLVGADPLNVESRLHFMRIAARAMRQVLFNAAERRQAAKRGGGEMAVTLNEDVHAGPVEAAQVLVLEDALRRLEALDPRQAQVVECRFYAGLTIEETAMALDISTATVNREWRLARAWLARALRPE
jgi:RNA polymerase sigma factor (TIGR02999 family)